MRRMAASTPDPEPEAQRSARVRALERALHLARLALTGERDRINTVIRVIDNVLNKR